MPSTRSQTTHNTRSTGRATIPFAQSTTAGMKRRNVRATSKSKTNSPDSAKVDDLKTKVGRILWSLVEKYFPWLKIVLEPFKNTNPVPVFITIAVTLTVYPFRTFIMESVSGFWHSVFTAELPGSVYFNEVSWPPRHRWIWRQEEVANVTREITRLSKDHDGKQIHMYLIGGPGSGKSELARQVGLRLYESMKQNNRPADIITIEAGSVTSLMASLVDAVFALCNSSGQKTDRIKQMKEELNFRFGDLFSYEGNILKTEMRLKVIFTKLKELLKERNSQPVLIFDNVQDLRLLFGYLNLEPGSKHFATFVVIVTLQKRVSLRRLSAYVQVQDLYEGMLPTDSVKLLKQITGLEEDKENHAYELSNILGHQPLALATAAIYIESVREGPPKQTEYSYSDYISEFKRDIPSLGMEEDIEWRESDASKYSAPMYTAVLKAVNRSAQNDPVFRDIACIGYTDSSPLSLSFILEFLKANSHHHFSEAQVRNSLRNVLFKVSGKEGQQTLSSHQVIREAFRQVCKVSHRNPNCLNSTVCNLKAVSSGQNHSLLLDVFARLALSFERELNATILNLHNVNATLKEPNYIFDSQCLDILTSLCVFSSREHFQVEDIINVRFSGMFLRLIAYSSGLWPGLIKPATNEFRLDEIVNLTNLQAKKGIRCDLQTLLLVVCLHSGATKSQNKGLMTAVNKTSMGILAMTSNTAISRDKPLLLNILGLMYRGLGYPHKSRDLHELALDLHRKNSDYGNDYINNNTRKGQIKHEEKILGEASTLHKLGVIYRYLLNLSSAQVTHEISLKLMEKLFGPHHPYIAGSLLNLAVVYSRQGKYSDALRLHNRSLAILQQTYGPRHANVGRVLNTIGTVYYKLGEFRNAIHYSEQGLEILEDFHGTYHPHVAEALNFLGFMYRDQGNLKKAQEVLERSVHIKEKVFDTNHFILGEALNDLGVVYTRLGEAQRAIQVLERALAIFKQTWGEGHTSVTTTLNSLGAAYCALGQPQEGVRLHWKVLDTLLSMGKGNMREHAVAETRHLLGNTYLAMGNLGYARLMYHLSYSGFNNLYGSKHWRVQNALRDLSSVDSILNKSTVLAPLFTVVSLSSLLVTV